MFIVPEVNVVLQTANKASLQVLPDLSFTGGVYGLSLLMGHLYKNGFLSKLKIQYVGLSGIFAYLLTVEVQIYAYYKGIEYNLWYNNATLVVAAFSIFVIAMRCKFIESGIISKVARLSFGIYLIHNPINMILARYFIFESSLVRLGVIFCVTLAVSFVFAVVLSQNKNISKIFLFIK